MYLLTVFIAIIVGWVLHEFTPLLFRSSTRKLDSSRGEQAEVAAVRSAASTPPRSPDSVDAQGFFNNSHHFVLNQPVIRYVNESKRTVLPWLTRFTMHGAEFDSSTRDPPPRCHPGTRITILETIHCWIDSTQHIHRLMWLNGPAGVGKSAIVQTLAEGLSGASRLGATLFFSRPHGCNNPTMVFPTIAYQLAVRIPAYLEYLHRRMTDDPKLLEKGMEHQFNILISEPFTNAVLPTDSDSWVILLDGLDECGNDEAQSLIIKLISHFSIHNPNAPLIWLIASRPEAHLKLTFQSDRVVGSFLDLNIPANSNAACQDVERFLRAKFKEIHYKYRDLIPVGRPWPAERDITSISESVQGFFVLASTLVRFIEDPHICDPISQLTFTLSIIENPEADPLAFLYIFYTRILDNVPKSMLPVLQMLLGWTLAAPILDVDEDADEYPLVLNATVFGLQQHTVYAALRKLHSVINVPPLEESGRRDIRFYHTSFADYLCDVSQSGEYAIDLEAVDTRVFWSYFDMLKGKVEDSHCDGLFRPSITLSWDSGSDPTKGILDDFCDEAMHDLIHHLTPGCQHPSKWHAHLHVSLTDAELQCIFEGLDFSRLFYQPFLLTYLDIVTFATWLMHDAPSILLESDLVKEVLLQDLDPARVQDKRIALELQWSRPIEAYLNIIDKHTIHNYSRNNQWYPTTYTNVPLELLHPDWSGQMTPTEELIPKLRQLCASKPTLRALQVGRDSSTSCVFILVEPLSSEQGSFYYLPYFQ